MEISLKTPAKSHETSGLVAGIAAFTTWGLIPVYWKLLRKIPASEILAHRFVWTSLFLVALLTWQARWPDVRNILRSRRTTLYCLSSGLAVALNWFFFIYAVNIGHVIETSLGYFMTPLVNVLFGAILLRERLTRWQLFSILLASAAVIYLTVGYGQFPWIALALCLSFGLYGLLRKQSGTAAIPGLFVETVLLVPAALAYLISLQMHGQLHFNLHSRMLSILLISTGIVTAVPLFWFGYAARHLRLTTIGFLQYLSPTGSFFLGVFLYREPFTRTHLITFSLIWAALGIFTFEAVTRWRSSRVRDMSTGALAASALD
jgi:chloramphenicol-sensitive protein RarD